MKINPKIKIQFLIQNSLFVALLLAISGILIFLSNEVSTQWDLTYNKRNTLSDSSLEILQQMDDPVSITAFATKSDTEGNLRDTIYKFIGPYKIAKSNLQLTFVDPRDEPQIAETANIRYDGELVIEYRGRKENLNILTEQELTNLFVRLSRTTEKTVGYVIGHGERNLEGESPRDMGHFGQQLMVKGLTIAPVNLTHNEGIPENLSLLIVASPKVKLLRGEANRIKRFLEKGGNLLWLVERDSMAGMDLIADYLGIEIQKGTVFDPYARSLNLRPTFALSSSYGDHPATSGSNMTSVFPESLGIGALRTSQFNLTKLVEASANGWLEMDKIKAAKFNADKDLRGPIVVAAALERLIEDKTQKIVLVGTGNFLANQYLGLVGNLDLGVNIVNWMAGDESLITIQPRARNDISLEPNRGVGYLLFFFCLLPLFFVITGGVVWWKRRKS